MAKTFVGTVSSNAAGKTIVVTVHTSKNHPLYLFSYYHGVASPAAGPFDTLHPTTVTAMGTYANAWITGFSDGTATHHRTGPNGDVATGQLVSSLLTHRDFPRG